VELIVVMVLIGVISAIAVPRLMDDGSTAASAFASQVASALRYAQKSAVAHRRIVCASLGPSQVTLSIALQSSRDAPTQSGCGAPLPGPIDAEFKSTDANVTASGLGVGGTLFFQPNGTITTDFAGTTLASGAVAIRLQNTTQRSIQIEGGSGYVD
jgi:MSHA pilin protein MshC